MFKLKGYVYILTNKSNSVIYIGVCKNLERRLINHRQKVNSCSFSTRYNLDKLVYYEAYTMLVDAIAREKQLKNWRRLWKVALIEKNNPKYLDLSKDFID